MLKKILLVLLLALPVLLFVSFTAFAQTGAIQGHSFLGGTQAKTSGLNSTNYLDGIVPSATITVYLTGTQTLATIYSNASGTTLSNPFTSNTVGSVNPGGYIFWAATNQGYDIVASGGISPNIYPQPVTLCTDCYPSSQFTITTGVTSAEGTSPIEVNGVSGTPETGAIDISCPTCNSLAIQSAIIPPISGQYAVVYPSGCSMSLGSYTGSCNYSQAPYTAAAGGQLISPSGTPDYGAIMFTFTLPSYITQGSITSVYADSMFGYSTASNGPFAALSCTDGTYSASVFGGITTPTAQREYTAAFTSVPTVSSITCTFSGNGSLSGETVATLNAPAVRLLVYSPATPPEFTGFYLSPPLYYNPSTDTLGVSQINLATSGDGGVFGILPVANGGTGTATPGLVAGTSITITGSWPNQTINASEGTGCSGSSANGACYNNGGTGTYSSDVLIDESGVPLTIDASGEPSQAAFTYNSTALVPGSSTTVVFGVNSSGQGVMSEAGGSVERLCDATNGVCGGGTTTNALTMNNSGSGAASGTTFNGSAAVTLSYNTLGAQGALTLTTTGSSGAATLSGNTLNIPQYSGGGSGTVNSGTANQIAYYASTGTAVSGTNALPNGTTATTQTTGDNTTKVATDAFVLANAGGSISLPFINVQSSPYNAKGNGQVAWDASIGTTIPTPSTGQSTTASAPAVTTNFANDVVVSGFIGYPSITFGTPSAGTSRITYTGGGGNSSLMVSDQTVASAGSVAAVTSSTGSGSDYWFGASMMLVPVSGQTISFVAGSDAFASGTTLTINQPTGATAGDVEFACLLWYSGGSPANVLTSPVQFPPFNYSVPLTTSFAGSNHPAQCWTRVVQSSDPSSYTWSQSVSNGIIGFIVDYHNVGGIDNPITQTVWTASTGFSFGSEIRDSNGCLEMSSGTGTTGSTAPTWPACTTGNIGETTTDASVTWILKGSAPSFVSGDEGKLLCGDPTFAGSGYAGPCGYVGNVVSTTELLPLGFANVSGSTHYSEEYRYASDDTAAIQDAINAAPASIVLPKANYGTSLPLIFTPGVPLILSGISMGGTFDGSNYLIDNTNLGSQLWFLTNVLNGPALQFMAGSGNNEPLTPQVLTDFGIYAGAGKSLLGGGIAINGIEELNWNNLTLQRLAIENFSGNGVYIDANTSDGTTYSEDDVLTGDVIVFNGLSGLQLGGTSNYVDAITVGPGVMIFSNGLSGITTASSVNGLTVFGNKVIDNNQRTTGTEIKFSGTPTGVSITGNYLETTCNGSGSTGFMNFVSSMAGTMNIQGNYYSQICASIAAPTFHFSVAGIALPSASNLNAHGAFACVSDATSCTAGTTYAGSGSTACQVQSNGTNWIETGAGCY
jgi:hypothetical protein